MTSGCLKSSSDRKRWEKANTLFTSLPLPVLCRFLAHLKESLTHLCKVLAPNCKACPRAGKSNIGASITQTCHFLGGSEAGICAAPLGSYPGSLPAARGTGVKRQDGPRESAGPGPEGTVQGRAQSSARHHIVHIFPLIPAVPPLPPALFRSHGPHTASARALVPDSVLLSPQLNGRIQLCCPDTNTPQRPYCTAQPTGS